MTSSALEAALDQMSALLASVTDDDLARPTPCSDWTVADLSDHVVNSVTGMLAMARGEEPDWASSPHHDDPAAAFGERASDLREAAAGNDQFPQGLATAELAVHAYDLSTGLGRGTSGLDPAVAEAGHAFMGDQLTEATRGAAFAPEQVAPDDADAYQRLAAFAGRSV